MVLIKGAKIVDGSGVEAPFAADVLLKDNRIAAIGKFPQKKADLVIDGLGLYLTPGFIDVNTDSDHHLSLFTNPEQQDFLLQGVTTIFGGLCGSSLAPLLSGSLDSIRKWTDTSQVNINWRSIGEFLKVLGGQGLGVNFGTFAGHSTIRRGLIKEDLRDLTSPELLVFKNLLRDALKEGVFGLSVGLGYAHGKRVPYSEIKELANLVAEANGVLAMHLRDEKEGVLASVEEAVRLAAETGVKIIINHFKPLIGFENDYRKAMELVHNVSSSVDIHIDNYPFNESVIPLYTLLPAWAQVGNLETMLNYLNNPDVYERLLSELSKFNGNDIKIAEALGREYLLGKTVAQFAENQEISVPESILKLMKLTGMRAMVFYRNINLDLIVQNLDRDQVLIASNGASLPENAKILKHRRFYRTFPEYLGTVLRLKMLSLPQAIAKITSVPAKKFNLKNRGLIKEDFIADLNLVSVKSGSVEIEHVIVGGKLAVNNHSSTGILEGEILRH